MRPYLQINEQEVRKAFDHPMKHFKVLEEERREGRREEKKEGGRKGRKEGKSEKKLKKLMSPRE